MQTLESISQNKPSVFGTDGIRGTYGHYPMVPEYLICLARASAKVLGNKKSSPTKVVIGRDTRESSDEIFHNFAQGLGQSDVILLDAGIVPTPLLAWLTTSQNCDFGVMITASHNPWQDNGIKFFCSDGFKPDEHQELEIEVQTEQIFHQTADKTKFLSGYTTQKITNAWEIYENAITHRLGAVSLDGLRIVVDCANGATSQIAPAILAKFGAEVVVINNSPNGRNINENCGSLHPEQCVEAVLKHKAQLGACYDGDGDRLILIDDKGEILDGDDIIAILANDLCQRGALAEKTVVVTVMSNLGLDKHLKAQGLSVLRTAVGDINVVREMRQHRASLGGEQSGHIILGQNASTGDGVLTSIAVAQLIKNNKTQLSSVRHSFQKYVQKIYNIPVRSKPPLESLKGVSAALEKLTQSLGSEGRVLLRYSGTEPKIRLLLEAPPNRHLEDLANPLINEIKCAIGI